MCTRSVFTETTDSSTRRRRVFYFFFWKIRFFPPCLCLISLRSSVPSDSGVAIVNGPSSHTRGPCARGTIFDKWTCEPYTYVAHTIILHMHLHTYAHVCTRIRVILLLLGNGAFCVTLFGFTTPSLPVVDVSPSPPLAQLFFCTRTRYICVRAPGRSRVL